MKVRYNNNISPEEQDNTEDEISNIIWELTDLPEDKCDLLGQQILAVVLSKFRPDLCLTEVD